MMILASEGSIRSRERKLEGVGIKRAGLKRVAVCKALKYQNKILYHNGIVNQNNFNYSNFVTE